MEVTYGSVADTAPEGFLSRRVHFNTLVRLNEGTKEGMVTRLIKGDGFGTRDLPRPIDGMGPGRGHDDTVPVGRLDKLTIDGNNVEGWAWIADTENGRAAFEELVLGISDSVSIVMADVAFEVDIDWPEGATLPSILQTFTQANMDRATLVMGPAFGSARGMLEEELTAALAIEGDLEVTASWTIDVPEPVESLTASALFPHPHEAFTVPEPETYQTVAISRDGKFVTGHLGTWEGCHTGFLDRCVRIPRSRSNYQSYCKSKQYTDKGVAYTGPIVMLRGHRATRQQINEALEDVANVWADVVVTDGKFGPWMCGVLRPGVTEEALAAARGSRISGHWLRGELYAVCATPAEGFDVPRVTKYSVILDEDNEVEELAASFAMDCGCDEDDSPELDETLVAALLEEARLALEDDDADASQEVSAP